ncbi:hypothetical protein CEXT_215081 [Caerostris extrusa]|uniref:Uncharacterized protein n=1 Tax=Caerostris extrusa TaxID=172846 RepID=A0AAV4W9F9_CAEEX|nr:hypothetical protein CEXT_215081 [Caerostris extrusa]
MKEKQKICLQKERWAARVLGIVMGVFMVCWLPFFPPCTSSFPSATAATVSNRVVKRHNLAGLLQLGTQTRSFTLLLTRTSARPSYILCHKPCVLSQKFQPQLQSNKS